MLLSTSDGAAVRSVCVDLRVQCWSLPCHICKTHPTPVQVTTEGGFDAAMEAPFVYGALDALACRSAAWAERRQHLLLEQAPPDKTASMPEPYVVAADAAAAVKQVWPLESLTSQMCKMELLPGCRNVQVDWAQSALDGVTFDGAIASRPNHCYTLSCFLLV